MRLAIAALLLSAAIPATASARSLEQIQASGTLGVCLPANSLPFSSRHDTPAGFQVELAGLLAQQLGVSLQTDWVISPIQVIRASCDLLLDVIADPEAQGESHLVLSKPYYRSGVALIVPQGSPITSFATLDGHTKVAVQVGSIVSMILQPTPRRPLDLRLRGRDVAGGGGRRSRRSGGDAGLSRIFQPRASRPQADHPAAG